MSDERRRPIEVIGHGGAGDFFPGNSRQAIEQALRIGVDRIEIDLQLSADGDLVLVHDEQFVVHGRKTPVDEIATRDFRKLLPGLLTLDELVALNTERVPLLLDVKLPGYERELIAAIHRLGLGQTAAVSSTHLFVLRRLRAAFPRMRLGLSTGHMATGVEFRPARIAIARTLQGVTPPLLLSATRWARATEVMIQHRVCTDRLVRSAHKHGLNVNVWTVDRPEQMRRLAAMGVDGIISNRPDVVRDVLTERPIDLSSA